MKLSGLKKILLLGVILLIIAGIVVVTLRGFKVSLLLQQHESVNIFVGKEVNRKDMMSICKEVFGNKKVVLRDIEYFKDSVNISVESITDEEKQNLVNKVNEKYGTNITVDQLNVSRTSNVRLRDLIRPYIKPLAISTVLIIVYLIIRFRKMSIVKLLGEILAEVVITEAALASIIAIARVPLQPIIVNIMVVIALVELMLYINKKEKEYKNIA